MHTKPPGLFVVPSLCLLVLIGSFANHFTTTSFSSPELGRVDRAANSVKEIAGYRSWAKVNAEPQLIPDRTAALCAAANLPTASNNPHTNKYVTIYVNGLGRKAMIDELNPHFPEGSVIVKEKLPDKSSQTPELLTVMIKHGKGFNPTSGDWEYMVVDGTGTNIQARGKLENCQACHTAKPGTDYVFRTYLPSEMQNKLK